MKIRLLLAFLLISTAVFAWMDPLPFPQGNWQYRAPITVTNNGSALADYQVAVNTTNLVYNNTGLVGSWHFSESAGTRSMDSSGNGNDGTYAGEALNSGTLNNFNFNANSGWVPGKYGSALQFDGVNDYVGMGAPASLNFGAGDFSISAWVKTSALMGGSEGHIASKRVLPSGTGYYLTVQAATGYLSFYASGTSSFGVFRETTTPLNDNQWHFVTAVRTATELRLYIDGALKLTASKTYGDLSNAGTFYLGTETGADNRLNGTLDDVRAYNRALSAGEISQLYQNNTFLRSGLAGYWRFDEGAGTIAQDTHHIATEQNLNGTKFGNALSFDGSNDYVNLPDSTSLNLNGRPAVTVDAWVYLNSAPPAGYQDVIYHRRVLPTTGDVFGFVIDENSKPYAINYINTRWVPLVGTSTLSLNTWYHLAYTYDGSTERIYVNGLQENSASYSGTINWGSAAAVNELGRNNAYPGNEFNGTMDEVRIYNRALSPQEIAALYNASRLRLDYGDLRFSQPYTIYETPITVSGTGTALTDYQVSINITNPAVLSHMKADGSDLRFFGAQTSNPYSGTGLPYWIGSINSTQARIWVKADVSSAGTTIYMYYGNPAAPAQSNGSATFLFFEDFEDQDISDWAAINSPSVSFDSAIKDEGRYSLHLVTGSNYQSRHKTFASYTNGTLCAEWSMRKEGNPSVGLWSSPRDSNVGSFGDMAAQTQFFSDGSLSAWNSETPVALLPSAALSTWYRIRAVIYLSNKTWDAYVYNTSDSPLASRAGMTLRGAASIDEINDWGLGGSTGGNGYFDGLRLRRCSPPEPSAALGAETVKSAGNEALAPYWQESDSRVWVKAASIPNGSSTIYAYYGNPNATGAGNGTATFAFFDDFNDGNYNGWSVVDGAWSASNFDLRGSSDWGDIRAPQALTNLAIAYRAKLDNTNDVHLTRFLWNNPGGYEVGYGGGNIVGFKLQRDGAEAQGDLTVINGGVSPDLNWHTFEARRYNGNFELFYDGASKGTASENNYSSSVNVELTSLNNNAGRTLYWDDVRVRKYASPEPSLSLQQEELQSPALFIGVLLASKTTYPAYNETFSLWVYNNQTVSDTFTLSCAGACSVSPASLPLAPYQNGSATVTITSANVSGTTQYTITATSQSNASNAASVSASLTVDATRWRSNWTDAYNREFKYRVPITISNGGSALTDYQVNVTVDTAAPIGLSRMRGDCGDLRLTNGTNEMPYWIEGGCNTTSAKIWARVPYVPAGDSTIYAYYGNANAASKSNGTAVFEFFDDFEDGTLGKWATPGSATIVTSPVHSGAKAILANNAAATISKKWGVAGNKYELDFWMYDGGQSARSEVWGGLGNSAGASWRFLIAARYDNAYWTYVAYPSSYVNTPFARNKYAYSKVTIIYDGGSSIKYTVNDGALRQVTNSWSDGVDNIWTGLGWGGQSEYLDDFRVRKYSSPEPSVLAGAEQSKGYRTLVRRCGQKQENASVSAYYSSNSTYANSCLSDQYGICSLEISAGTYDLRFLFADNSTAWKNGTVFG